MSRRSNRAAAALFGVLVLVGLAFLARPWVESGRVLLFLLDGPITSAARTEVRYQVAGRDHLGDLYRPEGLGRGGLVIVPGAALFGKDDRRLITLAAAMEGTGFEVLVPDIPSQRALEIGPENVDDVADAVDWLAGRERKVGVAAVSYGVGPAVLAGLREGDKLSFIAGLGGYYDLRALLGYFTTGWYFEDGAWDKRAPNLYGKWVFVASNAPRLWNEDDRLLLSLMAQRKLADPKAPIDDLASHMTSEAKSIYDLLANGEREKIPGLIDALPLPMKAAMDALDLKNKDLSGLHADLILIHGRSDAIIPSGESRKLAQAAPHARLYVVPDIGHVELQPRTIAGMWTLLEALKAILDERESG